MRSREGVTSQREVGGECKCDNLNSTRLILINQFIFKIFYLYGIMNKEEVILFLADQKTNFLEKFKITKIGFFGSMARSEKANDIDIIVEFTPDTIDLFEKKFELRELLKGRFRMPVDICREKSISPSVKKLIMQDVIFIGQGSGQFRGHSIGSH